MVLIKLGGDTWVAADTIALVEPHLNRDVVRVIFKDGREIYVDRNYREDVYTAVSRLTRTINEALQPKGNMFEWTAGLRVLLREAVREGMGLAPHDGWELDVEAIVDELLRKPKS